MYYHGADDGVGGGRGQKHTQDMSRQMQSDTSLVQRTSHTNVVQSSSEIEVKCCRCYELAAELSVFVTMARRKRTRQPFPSASCLA